jgi:hypothetical protein
MRGIWRGSLGLALGLIAGTARAGDIDWRRVPVPQAAAPAVVTLGRPVALNAPAPGVALGQPQAEAAIVPVAYSAPAPLAPSPIIRAQSPDAGAPPPPVPASPNIPPVPPPANERFNCGVVTEPPPAPTGHPFFQRLHDLVGGAGTAVEGIVTGQGAGRSAFESDHGFDVFSSPVSNPFLFEDPRSLTELRPLFIHEGSSTKNAVFHGGDVDYFGLQARLALTERLSVVMSEFGVIWVEPHDTALYGAHDGISELRIGPQYTFYRCEQSGTIAAAGLLFDIPIGPSKVFQDTGSLSLQPYVSFGQNFLKSSFGSFNFLTTIGYSAATDSKRSDYFYNSYHFDYDVANLHKIYPLIEFNYYHYTDAGTARPLGFEGQDLINFGSTGVSGRDYLSMAVGARYKFSERFQTGLAFEFPLTSPHDLLDYRLNMDVIFRW